jgi:hypothetical protein
MKRITLLPFACALIVACQDQRSPTAVRPPSAQLMDASTSGNRHFFFLPPLVKQPSFSGVFNPALKPVVEICELNVSTTPAACSGAPLIDPGPVTADLAGQQYKVNWDTRQSGISVDKFYRIQVFGSRNGMLLGFADVDPVNNGSGLKNVNTNEYIGLVDGRTLPIKFRIERGAFGTNCVSDCAEGSVPATGGTVITNTGFAGALFPDGWIRPEVLEQLGIDNVVVTIERVPVDNTGEGELGPCLPFSKPQFEGCYRFTTSPPVGRFAQLVTVGICVELPESDARHDGVVLFSVEEPVTSESPVTRLPNVPAPFVTCESFSSAGAPPAGFLGFARSGWRTLTREVASWLSPRPLLAAHVGAGGLTGSFSRIGWALPDTTMINFDVDPNGSAVVPGTIVNTLYNPVGVTFTRLPAAGSSFCGASSNVYANDHGPLAGGGFDFNSGNNTVTVCPEGTASDFSENVGGRIQASFSFPGSEVCLNVYPTGPGEGATGFIEAFNSGGTSLGKVTSAPGQADRICVVATGIHHVQFAGSVDAFAIFDNFDVIF